MGHDFSTNPHHNRKKHDKVHQVDLREIDTVNSLTEEWGKSGVFNAGQLGKAVDILTEAISNEALVFMGLAGAMVPGGMRKVIVQAIEDQMIHGLVTTGANITHDLIEVFGGVHLKEVNYNSDKELLEKGIDRVHDAFVGKGSFEKFEDQIGKLLDSILEENKRDPLIISPSDLLYLVGSQIEDEDSIVHAAYKHKVPIFLPAISDSILGLQIWLFSQFNNLVVDPISDIGKIQEIYHKKPSSCALLLGGGVPKNFTLQSALMASKQFDYAIQVTMDRVETGGLSGASLSEAISWGKIEPNAQSATVISDITIALPIILSAVRKRLNKD